MEHPRIRLFTKSWCGWCHEARRWLETHGFDYHEVDIEANPMAAREMQRISGQSRVPTIDVGGQVLADFDSRQLETFFRRAGFGANGNSPK